MQSNVIAWDNGVVTGATENSAVGQSATLADTSQLNRRTYEFSDHSLVARHMMQLYRTYPKRAGNSRGSAKCAIKITRDISVANADGSGEIVLPLIGEVSFSLPVGVTSTQTALLRNMLSKALAQGPTGQTVPFALTLLDNLSI